MAPHLATISNTGESRCLARDERGAAVIDTALLLGMLVCVWMFCITALGKTIVIRWNAIDNFFGAV